MASIRKKALAAVAIAASAALALSACGGSSNNSSSGSTGSGSTGGAATKGGTLNYFYGAAFEHTDPQRTYIGVDLTNLNRTVYRSLVSFPASSNQSTATTPVADLATNTGTSSNNSKTWSFTLKDGIKWQDGKAITCEDFKYGASRVFATDVITGGPNYLLSYLDVPTDPKTGLPIYTGPYNSTAAGKAAFDKAITCSGNTITYHFKKPWPDFPLAVASLASTDPFRKDQDQGAKSNYSIFSDGPYELQGAVDKESGFTLVRNPNYDPSTDNPAIRKALPDKIVFKVITDRNSLAQQMIADSGAAQNAITYTSVPPAYYTQLVGQVAQRLTNDLSPYVDYLVPNFSTLTNPLVRQALAAATDDQGWITAGGGSRAFNAASSIVHPSVKGYQPNPAFTRPSSGDVTKAKQLLQQAGVKLPYPITFTYESTPTYDKQAAALKSTWDKAGFNVTLDGVADSGTYYTNIQSPGNKADVMWAGWGADWPSAITVTPPLFDSRPNLTKASNGQDYGRYKSDAFNKLVDQAQNAASLADQTSALQQADVQLGKDVAYIPLEVQKFNLLRGSNIEGFLADAASNGYPDLGVIGVKH